MGEEHEMWKIWLDEYANEIGNIDIGLDNYSSAITGSSDTDWAQFDSNTHNNITLTGGGEEMLRVAKDGFYVRGVRVEADAKEAEQVYNAFKQWLTWASLTQSSNDYDD